ncbi:hypothetical protein OG301_39280 (plasmid) [Streptomyces platensis]|uniref:hypothetical protein n=1 Tax=Streptomyces platensis TaxID=58346 RepID=UPI002ED5A979|nr:hypothetical protein OG301_39280 [Streptomyces platensis]
MPTEPTAYGVRIDAQPGSASIRLDGTEVGHDVIGYSLQHDVHGALPQLVLHTRQPGGAIFEALAHVMVADTAPPTEAILGFLRTINPIELEQAALDRDDLGIGRYDLTRAMLAQLMDWAQERGAAA